jgi:ABC-2 type transport system permease protein
LSAYQGATAIKSNLGSGSYRGYQTSFTSIFSGAFGGMPFTYFMMLFGPIIGLALGFDAVCKERTSGSLSVLLSQPIFRDDVINGKFLAGFAALLLIVVSTVGIMTGLAIPIMGFGPTIAEVTGTIVFTLLTILYVGFWLALSLMFSTLFKKTTTSILAIISCWIFFTFAITIIATLISSALVPVPNVFPTVFVGNQTSGPNQAQMRAYQDASQLRMTLMNGISSISPSNLYTQASSIILTGMNTAVGIFIGGSSMRPSTDLTQAWPQFTAIAVALVVCFVVAYLAFLRREIRPGG